MSTAVRPFLHRRELRPRQPHPGVSDGKGRGWVAPSSAPTISATKPVFGAALLGKTPRENVEVLTVAATRNVGSLTVRYETVEGGIWAPSELVM